MRRAIPVLFPLVLCAASWSCGRSGAEGPPAASSLPPVTRPSAATLTPAMARTLPLMRGTAQSIAHGVLHLTDVQYDLPPGMPRPAPDIPLPPGRWITGHHWQSRGDTLDIFRGESVTYMVSLHVLSPGEPFTANGMKSFQGIVSAVKGSRVKITTYQGGWAVPAHWTPPTGTMIVRMAPYSWARTGYGDGRPATALKIGETVLVLWFGDASDRIVWQMTLLAAQPTP